MSRGPETVITVLQGQYRTSAGAGEVLSTLLGSCIATCISDPERGIGGMNHFLLPGDEADRHGSLRYGVNSMELLINALLRRGARRDRLEAKVFGGARMVPGLQNIGQANADFALWFLESEGIRCVGTSLGGARGRKLRYWPDSGRARQLFIAGGPPHQTPAAAPAPDSGDPGDITLF